MQAITKHPKIVQQITYLKKKDYKTLKPKDSNFFTFEVPEDIHTNELCLIPMFTNSTLLKVYLESNNKISFTC